MTEINEFLTIFLPLEPNQVIFCKTYEIFEKMY